MNTDYVWAAGVISSMGSFSTGNIMKREKWGQTRYTKYVLRGKRHAEVIKRIGDIFNQPVKIKRVNGEEITEVVFRADALHAMMNLIWYEGLTNERKREYKKIRDEAKASKIELEG